MKKNKGFSLVELLVVLAMLAVLMGLALVSFGPARQFSEKTQINTDQKILVDAIDAWVADNSNAIQRPANFYAINAQGHPVYSYINGNDIYVNTNLSLDSSGKLVIDENQANHTNGIFINFKDGVLTTTYVEKPDSSDNLYKKFFVFKTANEDSDKVDDIDAKLIQRQLLEKSDKYEPLILNN